MKVTDIKIGRSSNFVSFLLNKDIHNDILLDDCLIDITVEPDRLSDFLYRRLWETVYLRRKPKKLSTLNDPKSVQLTISFVEAINFIKSVTPPVYQSRVHELYRDIDNLKNSLELFLRDDVESILTQNHSIFKKGMGFQEFETEPSKYDMSRINYLRNKTNNDVVVDIFACTDFNSVLKGDATYTHMNIQGMISYYNQANLRDLLTRLKYELQDINILNVFHDDMNGHFIEFCILDAENFSNDFPAVTKLIQETYNQLNF